MYYGDIAAIVQLGVKTGSTWENIGTFHSTIYIGFTYLRMANPQKNEAPIPSLQPNGS